MRQIAATRRRDRLLQHIASCDLWKSFALRQNCDLSHEFKLVWIRATYRSDKISASSLVAAWVRFCDKSLRQNLNQPIRERQLFSHDSSENHSKWRPNMWNKINNLSINSEVSSPSGWNVTTSRMVIEFYKENRVLWDRNRKDYGKNSLQKWISLSFFSSWLHCRVQHFLSTCLYSSSSNSIINRTKSFFLFALRCIRWSAMLNLQN